MSCDGNLDLASTELDSHLREQIVWERNTIWRDMIEQERHTSAVRMRAPKGSTNRGAAQAQELVTQKGYTIDVFGRICTLPFNAHFASLLFSLAVFIGLLVRPTFDSVEQSNCLALLIFATLLWAFEVLLRHISCFC